MAFLVTSQRRSFCQTLALLLGLLLPAALWAQSAAEHYENASMAVAQQRDEAALIHLRNALQEDPRHLPSRILLGELRARNGEPASAEKELRRALELGADPNLVMVPLGYSLLLLEDYDAIIDFRLPPLTDAVALEWQVIRGRALLGANRPDEAYDNFQRLVERDPANVVALLGKANARVAAGDYAAAAVIADEILALDEDVSSAWKIKGDALRVRGEAERALDLYARALEVDPGNLAARKERSLVLLGLERYDDALDEAERLRFENPGDPQAELINAWLLARLRRDEEATALLEDLSQRLATVDPDFLSRNARVQLVTGLTLYLQGRIDESLPILSAYLLRQPGNVGVRMLLARIAADSGQGARVVELLEPIALRLGDQPELLAAYSRQLLREDRSDDAIALLAALRRDRPPSATLTRLLAATYAAIGREADAIALLAALPDASPDRGGELMLGYLLLEDNQLDAALAVVEPALARDSQDIALASLAGAIHLRRGDLDRAESLLEQAIARAPQDLALRLNLASLDRARGDAEAAMQAFVAISEDFPGNRVALKALSDLAVAQRDLAAALAWTEALAEVADADDPAPTFRLAGLYLADRRVDDALDLVARLERRYPLDEQLVGLKARAYLLRGDLADARRWLAYLSSILPAAADKRAEIADLQLAARDIAGAAQSVERLEALEPGSERAALLRARVEIAQGEGAAALTRLAALDRAAPDQVAVKDLLMEAAWLDGDGERLRRDYARAQALAPDSDRLHRAVGRLWQLGRGEDAEALLRDWLATSPDDAVAQERLAELLIARRQPQEAYAQYSALLERGVPLSYNAYNNLASLALDVAPERALAFAERAHDLNPGSAAVSDTLGWVLVRSGRAEEGLLHLRDAYTRAAREPVVRYHLAVALHRLDKHAEARSVLTELLAEGVAFGDQDAARRLLAELDGPG